MKYAKYIAISMLPWFIFTIVSNFFSKNLSIIICIIPTIIYQFAMAIKYKKLDKSEIFSFIISIISIIFVSTGGSIKFVLIEKHIVTLTLGISLLISVLLGKPLLYYVTEPNFFGNHYNNSNIKYKKEVIFRKKISVVTFFWGIMILLDASTRILLIKYINLSSSLFIGPMISLGSAALMILFCNYYLKKNGIEIKIKV